MNHFPVSHSQLSSFHLSLFLQEKYGFATHTSCHLIKAGISHTYKLFNEDNSYIFRLYTFNWRSKKEILEEIRLLNRLKENSVGVSFPVPDILGEFIQEFNAPEGKRFGVVFTYAPGEKMMNYSSEIHYKIGEIMAKMHLLTDNLRLDRTTYNAQELLIKPFEKMNPFLSADTEEMKFLQSVQQFLIGEYSKVNEAGVRTGGVHLDIWLDNFHIFENREVTLFDFDFCGNGWLCHDIGYYILQVFRHELDETVYKVKIDSFLMGYESITKISEEERRLFPIVGVATLIYYLGVQCERFDNWSNVFLNEFHIKRYINLIIRKWYDYNKLG